MYYAAIGLLGAMSMQGRVRIRWTQLVRYVVISTVVFIGIVSGVRAFNTHIVNVSYTQDVALQRLGFMESTRLATVVPHAAPANEEFEGNPPGIDEIVQRGVLRVCYQPNEYPSAFYTRTEPPQLVGFDIEMAHRLASGLQLQLELIPTQSEREAARLLDAGVADVYVRSLRVTARRTRMFAFTSPVYMSTTGLIVEDYRRREFETWQQLTERAEPLRLGVEDSPGEMRYAESLFPNAEFVAIEGMQMQREILESGFEARGLDAIVDIAEEGAAWTVLFPSYGMVVPKPSRASPVAYAVARGNRDLLLTIDAWLLAEKADGSVDTLYSHWMLGEAMKVDRPPRWSIIRNVLGWVD
jgi:ABC-type amino acid transport substrate-binding protein